MKLCVHQCFLQNFPYVICRKINAPAACPNSKECENFTEQPDGKASGTAVEPKSASNFVDNK